MRRKTIRFFFMRFFIRLRATSDSALDERENDTEGYETTEDNEYNGDVGREHARNHFRSRSNRTVDCSFHGVMTLESRGLSKV